MQKNMFFVVVLALRWNKETKQALNLANKMQQRTFATGILSLIHLPFTWLDLNRIWCTLFRIGSSGPCYGGWSVQMWQSISYFATNAPNWDFFSKLLKIADLSLKDKLVAYNDRKFSQQKLVKTYLQTAKVDDQFNSLMLISSEKDSTDAIKYSFREL